MTHNYLLLAYKQYLDLGLPYLDFDTFVQLMQTTNQRQDKDEENLIDNFGCNGEEN